MSKNIVLNSYNLFLLMGNTDFEIITDERSKCYEKIVFLYFCQLVLFIVFAVQSCQCAEKAARAAGKASQAAAATGEAAEKAKDKLDKARKVFAVLDEQYKKTAALAEGAKELDTMHVSADQYPLVKNDRSLQVYL
jgi:hypothetical protein